MDPCEFNVFGYLSSTFVQVFKLGTNCVTFTFLLNFAPFSVNTICDLLQQNPEQVAWDYFEI